MTKVDTETGKEIGRIVRELVSATSELTYTADHFDYYLSNEENMEILSRIENRRINLIKQLQELGVQFWEKP